MRMGEMLTSKKQTCCKWNKNNNENQFRTKQKWIQNDRNKKSLRSVRKYSTVHKCANMIKLWKRVGEVGVVCIYSTFWTRKISSMYVLGGHRVNQNMLLTIPGVLGLSAGLWLKLPLWLVETVCDFLLLRPMASIDWLLLRMTRYRERRGHMLSVDPLSYYEETQHSDHLFTFCD